jgi:hypothetical protein
MFVVGLESCLLLIEVLNLSRSLRFVEYRKEGMRTRSSTTLIILNFLFRIEVRITNCNSQ